MRSWVVWAGLAVSAAFAYLAVRDAHLDEVWAALKRSDYVWLLPAFGALTLWFRIRAVRLMLPWLPEVTWVRTAAILAAVILAALVAAIAVLVRFGERPLVSS